MTLLLYEHNNKITEKNSGIKANAEELKCFLSSNIPSTPSFRVVRKCEIPGLSWILESSSLHSNPIDLSECSVVQDGILITEEAADMITLPDATKLLQNAAHTSSIAVYMQIKSVNSPLFEYRFLPFMLRVSHILLSRQATNQCTEQRDLRDFAESAEYQTNLKRLDSMLGGWGMAR